MNRDIMKGITVLDDKYYANDALQHICAKIFPVNNAILLHHLDNTPREERPAEYWESSRNQESLILMFDNIVSKGKEFALQFIEQNKTLI